MRLVKNKKGFTIIGLIITIIVLLILVGVSLNVFIGENGIINKSYEAKYIYEQKEIEEKELLSDINNVINQIEVSNSGYDEISNVNKPKITTGMIPVYYDGTTWRKADLNNINKQWYDYSENIQKWANIATVSDEVNNIKNYRDSEVGTEIPIYDMTSMFVWIPRYAYSIINGYKNSNEENVLDTNASKSKKIDVTFLVGNKDIDKNGIIYRKRL